MAVMFEITFFLSERLPLKQLGNGNCIVMNKTHSIHIDVQPELNQNVVGRHFETW